MHLNVGFFAREELILYLIIANIFLTCHTNLHICILLHICFLTLASKRAAIQCLQRHLCFQACIWSLWKFLYPQISLPHWHVDRRNCYSQESAGGNILLDPVVLFRLGFLLLQSPSPSVCSFTVIDKLVGSHFSPPRPLLMMHPPIYWLAQSINVHIYYLLLFHLNRIILVNFKYICIWNQFSITDKCAVINL